VIPIGFVDNLNTSPGAVIVKESDGSNKDTHFDLAHKN
jgi:hypothetical protein